MKSARTTSIALCFVAVTTGVIALASTAPIAEARSGDRSILRCVVNGPNDTSLSVRHEQRGSREKFSAETEAAPNRQIRAGHTMVLKVAGVTVGRTRFDSVAGGNLVADINFDTNADGPDEQPFPNNFPNVGVGTRVEVRVAQVPGFRLSCTLRR